QVLAVEDDLPAIDLGQAGDAAQQGGLAAAGRAEQGDELAFFDFAIDVAEDRGGPGAFVQAADTQVTHEGVLVGFDSLRSRAAYGLSLFRRVAAQVKSNTKKK